MRKRPLVMWSAVCLAPQSQLSLVDNPQRSTFAPNLPTPVHSLFSQVQARRDRPTPCAKKKLNYRVCYPHGSWQHVWRLSKPRDSIPLCVLLETLPVSFCSTDLSCWLDIEAYRRTSYAEEKVRDEKAHDIQWKYLNKKYFFGPNSPAGKKTQAKVSRKPCRQFHNVLMGRVTSSA